MAKQKLSVLIYSGSDTYGRPIEVALRSDGKAWWRSRGFNGYGVSYTKWAPYNDVQWCLERMPAVEPNDGVPVKFAPGELMQWGFNVLRTSGLDQSRYVRLPKESL